MAGPANMCSQYAVTGARRGGGAVRSVGDVITEDD